MFVKVVFTFCVYGYLLLAMVESLDPQIKLENETHIYCVGEKNVDLPIFITPPLPEIQNSVNLITPKFWVGDDWQIKNSTELLTEPVLDRRWEDFPFVNTTTYKRFSSPLSASFSIFGQTIFQLFVDNHDDLDFLQVETEKSNDWNNFVIFTRNGKTYFKQNNIDFHTTEDMVPTKIVFKSNQKMFTKVHEYKYVEATRPSEDVTYLTIPPMGKSLLVLYTILCRFCTLEVIVDGKLHLIHSNFKENSILNEWQSHQFDIDPNAETKLQFIRKLNGPEEKPLWALDARLYDNKINRVVYEVNITDETEYSEYSCSYLKDQEKEMENKRMKRSVDNLHQCPVGMLGQDCDIDCKVVLGESYPTCEKHRICTEAMCFCSWGFTGSFCKDICKSGTWGADCDQTCPSQCSTACDSITGQCAKSFFSSSLAEHTFNIPTLVVCGLFVIAIIIAGILLKPTFITLLNNRNQQQDAENGLLQQQNVNV